MPTFPLQTVACTVDSTGIGGPPFADILSSFQASVQAIYGADIYIDPDSKDGQLLAMLAQAQFDSNLATIDAYNSFNPQTAVGPALDSSVKPNSIKRLVFTYSAALLTLVGQQGKTIPAGIVQDLNGFNWALPLNLTFPASGQILAVATCTTPGNILAPANSISKILTIISGWQSATNALDAVAGAPVESDGGLRARQTVSVSISAETTLDSLQSAVAAVRGVVRSRVYQNDTDVTDNNTGIPSHSIAVVVQGGDVAQLGAAILAKKDVGVGTYGDQTTSALDKYGNTIIYRFFQLHTVETYVAVYLTAFTGYDAGVALRIQTALFNFINALSIGQTAYTSWAEAVASLSGADMQTFAITQINLGTSPNPGAPLFPNLQPTFNETFTMSSPNNVTITTV